MEAFTYNHIFAQVCNFLMPSGKVKDSNEGLHKLLNKFRPFVKGNELFNDIQMAARGQPRTWPAKLGKVAEDFGMEKPESLLTATELLNAALRLRGEIK